jgi:hypothetical protein
MRFLSIFALVFVGCMPAHAQSQDGSASQLVEAVTSCRDISDPGQRLACFDRAAAKLADAKANRGLVVVDREEVKKTRRSLFGFTLPKIKLFGGDGDKEDPAEQQVSSVIRTAVPLQGNHWAISLEDGSRWQTNEPKFGFSPRAGATLNIEKGALGNYWAWVGNGRRARVRRVQ